MTNHVKVEIGKLVVLYTTPAVKNISEYQIYAEKPGGVTMPSIAKFPGGTRAVAEWLHTAFLRLPTTLARDFKAKDIYISLQINIGTVKIELRRTSGLRAIQEALLSAFIEAMAIHNHADTPVKAT
jgi:hypothetical protein